VSRQDNSKKLKGLAEEGERFYAEHLRNVLEPQQTGRFVAIEPEVGRYFIGGSGSEALVAAHEAMPDSLFYLKRVGYDFTHQIGGRSLRRQEEA
jgi:hypothetical protein